MRAPKKRNHVRTYRSSADWYRQLSTYFPELAAAMPDPRRMPLFPVPRGPVSQQRTRTTRRLQGGRTDGR